MQEAPPSSIPGWRRSPGEGIGYPLVFMGFPVGSDAKEFICSVGDLGQEGPLEEGMEPTPAFLPGKFPRTEELGGLQPMGSQRVGHD